MSVTSKESTYVDVTFKLMIDIASNTYSQNEVDV